MFKDKLPKACDALILGSGAAALMSALTLKRSRPDWNVWVAEKTDSIGGTTVYSGGVCWLPGNSGKENPQKDLEDARIYLKEAYPEIDGACMDAYLQDSPKTFAFMRESGVAMETWPEYPDYYQHINCSSTGRSVFPDVYKGPKKIRKHIRKVPLWYPPFTIKEAKDWGEHRLHHWNKSLMAKRKMLGHMTLGQGFIGFLLEACVENGVQFVLNSKAENILIQNGDVTGVVINDKKVSAGVVVVACGGFSHNPELMKKISAVRQVYSVASEDCDTDGGLALGIECNLKIRNPYCWWIPIFKMYQEGEEKPGPDLWAYHPTLHDRAWPGGIMVNAEGKRFTNEAAPYNTVGGILAQTEDPALDRTWLIWGNYYVRHYIRGNVSWMQPAKNYMNKSRTIQELASKIDIPATQLKETIEHWNDMAARERDDDFHRGESRYDQFMGDEFRDGHPNIAPLEPPYQAVRIYPGCLSTKMGPWADEFGRLQSEDGKTISGLYGAGNAVGSFLGNIYPGAGGTLGPAVVFAYRGARHACGKI